jgi:hypothetical protein
MRRLLEEDATAFERMLLESASDDLAPEGAKEALLDRFDAPVVPIASARKKQRIGTLVCFAAALLGVAIVVLDRRRAPPPIAREVPAVTAPTNVPVPVSSETPVAEMPLPPASVGSPAPPAVSYVRRGAFTHVPVHPVPSMSSRPEPARETGRTADFDRGATAHALSGVEVQSCKTGAETGLGHVTVTFETDGHASSAVVDQGVFLGTATGACVAARYRAVTVPPFEGSAVRVGKSFAIN